MKRKSLFTQNEHRISLNIRQINTMMLFVRTIIENASYYAELDQRHKELVGETVEIGLMFASKAFVQLLINPVVGLLTYR